MRRSAITWGAVLLVAITATPALGDTIVVDHAGSGDYTDIQDGIDAASPGDTVLVLGGTYTGERNRDLDFGGTALRLEGSPGHDLTTIDCEGAGRGFHFHSGEDTAAVVHGVMITNASADSGAGAFCQNGSGPKFDQCMFIYNHANLYGGGLCVVGSSPILRDCFFDSNTASDMGRQNGRGAGIACLSGSDVTATGAILVENISLRQGGGLYVRDSRVTFASCDIYGNQLTTFGNQAAGAYLQDSSNSSFTDCRFEQNGGIDTVGGGLVVYSSSATVTGCSFLNNTAGAAGGARVDNASTTCVFDGCTFAGNVATWAAAGAVHVIFGANVLITKCTFVDNGYSHVLCQEASPDILECILAFSRSGPPIVCNEGTETPLVTHCYVFGNAAGNELCGGNHYDNELVDPAFCSVWDYDLTLCADSPCLPDLNPWGMLIGAHGEGCPPCGTAVESRSWGAIKAMYR